MVAASLEALARALREWPNDAWHTLATTASSPDVPTHSVGEDVGLFERLVARVAPLALKPPQREAALGSAEAAAAVLRCLWPHSSPSDMTPA